MIPPKLLDEINLWINEKRYGNLQINFGGGKVVSVNKSESVRVAQLGSNLTDTTVTATVITNPSLA